MMKDHPIWVTDGRRGSLNLYFRSADHGERREEIRNLRAALGGDSRVVYNRNARCYVIPRKYEHELYGWCDTVYCGQVNWEVTGSTFSSAEGRAAYQRAKDREARQRAGFPGGRTPEEEAAYQKAKQAHWEAEQQRHGYTYQAPPQPPPPRPIRLPVAVLEAYDLFHLKQSAPLWVAEAVWRAASQKYHPDRGGTHEQAKKINAAIAAIRGHAKKASTG